METSKQDGRLEAASNYPDAQSSGHATAVAHHHHLYQILSINISLFSTSSSNFTRTKMRGITSGPQPPKISNSPVQWIPPNSSNFYTARDVVVAVAIAMARAMAPLFFNSSHPQSFLFSIILFRDLLSGSHQPHLRACQWPPALHLLALPEESPQQPQQEQQETWLLLFSSSPASPPVWLPPAAS